MSDFDVYIYPHYNADDAEAQNAKDSIDVVIQQLESHGSINHGNSTIRYDYPEDAVVDDNGDLDIAEFEDWRNVVGRTETGSHLLVTNNTYEDSSLPHAGRGDVGGFTSDRDAVVHYRYLSGFELKNTYIQEVLHNFLDDGNQQVQGLLGSDNNIHDLGHVIFTDFDHGGDTGWYVSPMATGYGPGRPNSPNHWEHGSCDNGSQRDGWTRKLSSCTKDGVMYTNPNV